MKGTALNIRGFIYNRGVENYFVIACSQTITAITITIITSPLPPDSMLFLCVLMDVGVLNIDLGGEVVLSAVEAFLSL